MDQQGANWPNQSAGMQQPGSEQQAWQQTSFAQPYQSYQQQYAPPAYAAPASATVVAQEPKRRGWIVALVAVVAMFLFMTVSVVSCSSMATASMNEVMYGLGGSAYDQVDMLSEDAIGVITISGTIQYDGTTCSPEGLKEQLDRAEENDYIKAIVLRVDSGGGVATAGEEMATYLRDFSKPVVVSSASLNASAAYEISSQADFIYVAKTTQIGSIGTIMQATDYSELLDKLGISVENIASADSKDSSYGTRPLTEEERAHYQSMVDQINETFIQMVADGRGMDVEAVRALATGLSYTGIDAVENGLADEIGTKEDAVAKAAELAGVSTTVTVPLEGYSMEMSDLFTLLYGSEYNEKNVAAVLKELESHGNVIE